MPSQLPHGISATVLPDKAIDLVDEAGAYREIHPTDTETQTVDKALITDTGTYL